MKSPLRSTIKVEEQITRVHLTTRPGCKEDGSGVGALRHLYLSTAPHSPGLALRPFFILPLSPSSFFLTLALAFSFFICQTSGMDGGELRVA